MQRLKCSHCNGLGHELTSCPSCGGEGQELCLMCKTRGYDNNGFPCHVCDGDGQHTCLDCTGTGNIADDMCLECDGEGHVEVPDDYPYDLYYREDSDGQ